MFDPDAKQETEPVKKPLLKAVGNMVQSEPVVVMTRKDWFRHYLRECSGVREAHGFGMVDKKLVIVDVRKLERLDPETKSILRELYLEMK